MNGKFVKLIAILVCLAAAPAVWAQWSSNPDVNLPLADKANGSDQVQPKVKALPTNQWYVSWFDFGAHSTPPRGYDVYYQLLSSGGVEQFKHDGIMVADLSNSSTEDYGLDIDTGGHALLAFLDTREGANQQVTATKLDKDGHSFWGPMGVQLTNDNDFHAIPKIAGTSDGNVVVAWTSNSLLKMQRLDPQGHPLWSQPLVFGESGFNYNLADLHAADNGSVIVSWERDSGFSSNHQLRANKVSANGQLLWATKNSKNVILFDQGSLQFGEFPYFIPDGSGGAVFSWYTNGPTLQCFAQHIRADGSEAFPHNGSPGSTNLNNVRVSPSISYQPGTDETFMFWTEEDSNQFYNGVYGQKFNGKGARQWSQTGLVLVPLGTDQQIFVSNVQVGTATLVMWVDSPGYGSGTIQATKVNGIGRTICAQFPVSSASANKSKLSLGIAGSGLAAVAWADDRIGNNAIYIQNVNRDCSLGQE
ncbi:MAG TPA: hypothetical protein VF753_04135 [Terriglobales bacterium]